MLVRLLRSVAFLAKISHINYIDVVIGNPKSVDSQVFVDPLGLWPCSCRPVREERVITFRFVILLILS